MSGNQRDNTGSDPHYSEHLQTIGLYGFSWTAPWEFDFHLGFQLFDPGSSFDDLVLYGFKGSILKLGSSQHLFLEGMKQDICHRVQEQAELVCLEAMTGRAVTSQIQFMLFDPQFCRTSCTVALFIQGLCSELNQVGDDVADIGSHGGYFDLNDHLLWIAPGSGLVRERMVAFNVLAVLLIFSFRTYDGCCRQLMQLPVSAHPSDVTGIVLFFTPAHKIGGSKMAITTNNDHRIGPFLSEMKDQLFQKRGNIGLLTPSARFEDRGDQLTRETLINMQGHVAVITVIMVVQVQFLLTVGIVVGIITIQNDDSRFPVVRLDKDVHQFLPYAIQILVVYGVLQAAHRGLGGQRKARLRRATGTELKDHIITQIIAVVTVLISCGYLGNTLGKHLRNSMVNIAQVPVVSNTAAYALNQSHTTLNFTKKKKAAIAADIITGEAEFNLFVFYWKKLVN